MKSYDLISIIISLPPSEWTKHHTHCCVWLRYTSNFSLPGIKTLYKWIYLFRNSFDGKEKSACIYGFCVEQFYSQTYMYKSAPNARILSIQREGGICINQHLMSAFCPFRERAVQELRRHGLVPPAPTLDYSSSSRYRSTSPARSRSRSPSR